MRRPSILRNLLGYAVFATLLSWFIPASLVLGRERLVGPVKAFARLIFRVVGVDLRLIGVEHFDPGRGYLFMCNHQTLVDHFFLLATLPGRQVGLEKRENRKLPLYGWAARRWGQIFIDRDNPESALVTCREVVDRLKDGASVMVFPEGTRTRDGELGPFKKGMFYIATGAGVPVVPVVVRGGYPLMPRGRLLLTSGRVDVVVGAPIPPEPETPEGREALRAQVRAAMESMLGESGGAHLGPSP